MVWDVFSLLCAAGAVWCFLDSVSLLIEHFKYCSRRKATGGMRDDEQPEDEMYDDDDLGLNGVDWTDTDNWKSAAEKMIEAYGDAQHEMKETWDALKQVCTVVGFPHRYSADHTPHLLAHIRGLVDVRNRTVDRMQRLEAENVNFRNENESLRKANAELSAHLGILPGETG